MYESGAKYKLRFFRATIFFAWRVECGEWRAKNEKPASTLAGDSEFLATNHSPLSTVTQTLW